MAEIEALLLAKLHAVLPKSLLGQPRLSVTVCETRGMQHAFRRSRAVRQDIAAKAF